MNKWPDSQNFDLNVIISLNFATQILSLIYSPNVPCLSVSRLASASPHDPLVPLTYLCLFYKSTLPCSTGDVMSIESTLAKQV